MKLKDFYFADRHAAGTKMAILLPSGEDSGESLQVMGPHCDEAIQAGRAYIAAIRAVEDEMRPLFKECKELGDFTKYNERYDYRVEDLNKQLAAELVTGWSFDEPFSKEAFTELLHQYRQLAGAVVAHHTKTKVDLSEK